MKMEITYRHYRFSKYPQPDSEEFIGRHGMAYHYQRGSQWVVDHFGNQTKVRKTVWEPLPRGGYTVCTVYDDEREIAVGIAECSPLDSFCYRIGREVAKGRVIKSLFDRYTDSDVYTILASLGWTTARSLREFGETRLYKRYTYTRDYFLKGGVSFRGMSPVEELKCLSKSS